MARRRLPKTQNCWPYGHDLPKRHGSQHFCSDGVKFTLRLPLAIGVVRQHGDGLRGWMNTTSCDLVTTYNAIGSKLFIASNFATNIRCGW